MRNRIVPGLLLAICISSSCFSQNIKDFKRGTISCHEPDATCEHCVLISASCGKQKTATSCGSSILNEYNLLTAAHCVDQCSQSTIKVVGVYGDPRDSKTVSIRSLVIHEDYDAYYLRNDIALLVTRQYIKFGDHVKRIAIMRMPPYYEPAFIAVWRPVDDDNVLHEEQWYSQEQLLQQQQCSLLFELMRTGTMCGRTVQGYDGEGKSGSALLVRGYIQIGIVSHSMMSRRFQSTTVYTDVGFFYDWVVKNAKFSFRFLNRQVGRKHHSTINDTTTLKPSRISKVVPDRDERKDSKIIV